MAEQIKILAIDDDNISHKFIHRALDEQFETTSAYNGEQGIAFAMRDQPNIILLDVEMPGLTGYEVCEKLKQLPETKSIPVVFLSGRSSMQERMQGFDVGADDYLTKPFESANLVAKINVLLRYDDQQKSLLKEVEAAKNTAHIAMTGSSELGQIIQLIEQSYILKSIEELADYTLKYTESLGLHCSLLIKKREEYSHFTSTGTISPLELELLKKLRNNNRFNDFSCRTQINFPNISILIKNMPIEDREKYGRIKDLMPAILGPLDSKIRAQNVEDTIKSHAIALNSSFQNIKEAIQMLNYSLRENSKSSHQILREMLDGLSLSLPGMGLESDQEEYILDCIETAISKSNENNNANEDLTTSFTMLISQLEKLVEEQYELLSDSQSATQSKNEEPSSTPGNVELF